MARLIGNTEMVVGETDDIHTTQRNPLGAGCYDENGAFWIYGPGVASCVAGSWVTYDEAMATTLLAANAIGPVAVAGAALVASTWGWFCVFAPKGVSARLAANCADNASIGREGSDGDAGDGRAAGDQIIGAITREASTSAAVKTVQIYFPSVNDITGS